MKFTYPCTYNSELSYSPFFHILHYQPNNNGQIVMLVIRRQENGIFISILCNHAFLTRHFFHVMWLYVTHCHDECEVIPRMNLVQRLLRCEEHGYQHFREISDLRLQTIKQEFLTLKAHGKSCHLKYAVHNGKAVKFLCETGSHQLQGRRQQQQVPMIRLHLSSRLP